MAERAEVRGVDVSAPRLPLFVRTMDGLVRFLEIYAVLLMVGMAVVVLLGVWYRYVVQRALPWYDEFAEFLLVWLTFYGSVLAAQRKAHIGFETLATYLPRSWQVALEAASEVVVLVVQAALFYYGWQLAQAATFDSAVSLRWLRLSWVYSAIPVSGGLMFLVGAARLVRMVLPRR